MTEETLPICQYCGKPKELLYSIETVNEPCEIQRFWACKACGTAVTTTWEEPNNDKKVKCELRRFYTSPED